MKKILSWIWTYLKSFTNWRFLVCFGLAWMITNGIWYIFAFVPLNLPEWLVWFSRTYIAILYLPFTPEKLITIPISIWLLVKIFKNHEKTRLQLDGLYKQAKEDWAKIKSKLKRKKKEKEDE